MSKLFGRILTSGAVASAVLLAACGGGGGGGSSPVPSGGGSTSPTPSPIPTTSVQSYAVGGTVSQIPSDAYGPTTIGSASYASADAANATPLSGAKVIVGPVPVLGATPPATLPSGDVLTTTTPAGAFTATLAVAAAAPTSAAPFVVPPENLSGFTPPATGYYVEVFAPNADGLSAGVPIPLHRFMALSTTMTLRVTSPSTAEAAALAAVNSDRASNAGASALTFDESSEETARLHANDEANQLYYCHYDAHNIGPASRYLAVGGIGITGESLGLPGSGVTTTTYAFQVNEQATLAEKTQSPVGGHYLNLVDSTHTWAGLAAVPTTEYPNGFYAVDYEFVTPDGTAANEGVAGYEVISTCPSGTVLNNS